MQPSATSSLGYWLRDGGEEGGSASPGSSSGGEVSPAQAASALFPAAAAVPTAAQTEPAADSEGDGVPQEEMRLQAEHLEEHTYALRVR